MQLPLNPDALTVLMAMQPNSGPFVDSAGHVGDLGDALSSFVLPAGLVPPELVGMQMDFAEVVFGDNLASFATNTVSVTLVQ